MMERKDFLGLIGFGVLGAQTVRVTHGDATSEPAENPEPEAVRVEDLDSLRTSYIGVPENPHQGAMCFVLGDGQYRHMIYMDGEWLTLGVSE